MKKTSDRYVLLVDDEEPFRMSVEDGLARYRDRFSVVTASNGVQALGIIESKNPSLVVSDMRMPKMDGIELLLNCRRLYPRLPVILVSAYFSEELERNARSFGAAAVLHKPLDLNVLVDAITGVLEHSEMRGDSSGYLANFSLSGFLSLLSTERRTCTIAVRRGDGSQAKLWFETGMLIDAVVGDATGRDAALEILRWESGDITMLEGNRAHARRVNEPLSALVAELEPDARSRAKTDAVEDVPSPSPVELDREVASTPVEPASPTTPAKTAERGEPASTSIDATLEQLKGVAGFIRAAVCTGSGELLAEIPRESGGATELGAYANGVLLRARSTAQGLDAGDAQLIHIAAARTDIIIRPQMEPRDPTIVRFFTILVLSTAGNLALAKLMLATANEELAAVLP